MSQENKESFDAIKQQIENDKQKLSNLSSTHESKTDGQINHCENIQQPSQNTDSNQTIIQGNQPEMTTKHELKSVDFLCKLIDVENLKNSMIQDSPLHKDSNNSSITESNPSNNILGNQFAEVRLTANSSHDIKQAPVSILGQQFDNNQNQNERQSEDKINSNLLENQRDGNETKQLEECINNLLIRKVMDEENLEDSILNNRENEELDGIENRDNSQKNNNLLQVQNNNILSDKVESTNSHHPKLLFQCSEVQGSPSIKLLQSEYIQDSSNDNSSILTTNSLLLDNHLSEKDNAIQRSHSYQANQQIQSTSLGQNNQSLSASAQITDSHQPNISLFAQMSKQQSRRDMKNWAQGKSFGGGSNSIGQRAYGSLANSAVLTNKASFQQSNGSHDDSVQGCQEDNSIRQTAQSVIQENLSESVPICAQPKKTISFLSNKKPIKITNTKSTELKNNNFQDDDIINLDQKAYQNLAQSYNINSNISISIKTLLSYTVSNNTNTTSISSEVNSNKQNTSLNDLTTALGPIKKMSEDNQQTSFEKEEQDNLNLKSKPSFDNQRQRSLSLQPSTDQQQYDEETNEKQDQINVSSKLETKKQTKKVILPVLISVKTEEQMMSFQYFEQMNRNPSGKEIRSLHQIDGISSGSKNVFQPIKEEEGKEQSIQKNPSLEQIHLQEITDEIKELNNDSDNANSDDKSSNYNSESDSPYLYDEQISDTNKILSEESKKSNAQPLFAKETVSSEDHVEFEQSRKISQKNIIMKSISSKAKKSKHKIQKKQKEKQEKYNQCSTQSYENVFGGSQIQQPMRFPIDLICVIDTSGSMNGEPLELLKETLLFLVDLLQAGDRVCLIQFSTNAKRLTPLLSIEAKDNIELIKGEINKLIAKGGTNINQGMQLAFDVLKQRRYKNPITSVFLLSDGLNDGAENRIRDLLKQLNFYQNYTEENFTIQTFGFGKDHDPNLMDKISQLMDGNFYYIGDIHRIDECFIDALGGLFSVVSQNVSIKVRVPNHMRNSIRIVKTYGDIWHTKEIFYEYDININQLLSGVSKDYILEIEIDPQIIEDSQCIQEIFSEEDILSSEHIGSQRSFDMQTKPSLFQQGISNILPQQLSEILEMELKAKYISLHANPQPILKPFLEVEQSKFSQQQSSQTNEPQSSIPDLNQKEIPLNQTNNEAISNKDNSKTKTTEINVGADNENQSDKNIQHKKENKQHNYTSPSQSDCSQLSINVIPSNAEEQPFSINITNVSNLTKKSQKDSIDFSPECVTKKETLNLKNHRQIQENQVKLHYLRVKGAEGLDKCQSLALQKKFDEGNEYVNQLLQELNEQPEDTRKSLQKLIIDLTEAQDTLRKKVGEQVGWHRMISCKRMHMEQRSTGTDLAYQNSVQKLMVQRRKSIKDQNSIQSLTETVQKLQQALQSGSNNMQNSQQNQTEIKDKESLTSSESSSSGSDDESDYDDNNDHFSEKSQNSPNISPNITKQRKIKSKSQTLNPTHNRYSNLQQQEKSQQQQTQNQQEQLQNGAEIIQNK